MSQKHLFQSLNVLPSLTITRPNRNSKFQVLQKRKWGSVAHVGKNFHQDNLTGSRIIVEDEDRVGGIVCP